MSVDFLLYIFNGWLTHHFDGNLQVTSTLGARAESYTGKYVAHGTDECTGLLWMITEEAPGRHLKVVLEEKVAALGQLDDKQKRRKCLQLFNTAMDSLANTIELIKQKAGFINEDISPDNTLFRDGLDFAAIIDWDQVDEVS